MNDNSTTIRISDNSTIRGTDNATIRSSSDSDIIAAGKSKVVSEPVIKAVNNHGAGRQSQESDIISAVGDVSQGKLSIGKEIVLGDKSYNVKKVFHTQSGEADIYLVERSSIEYVLKYYRDNINPKMEILEKLRNIDHEDIVKLIDYGNYGTRTYELLEFAKGGSLDSYIKEKGPITDPVRLQNIISQVINALNFLHTMGIIHQDIKPENIYFKDVNHEDIILADFGISSLADSSGHTASTSLFLTPGYAAPEMASQGNTSVIVDAAIDYYALGITLLYIYQGQFPFHGMNNSQISRITLTGKITIPSSLPTELSRLIKGLTTFGPEQRWKYNEVKRWLKGENVLVSSQSFDYSYGVFRYTDNIFAEDLSSMANCLEQYPDLSKKYLFKTPMILDWIRESKNNHLFITVQDLIDQYRENQDSGLYRIIYAIDPGHPFVTNGKKRCGSFREIGEGIKSEYEYYRRALKNNDDEKLFIFLQSIGELEFLNSLQELRKTSREDFLFHYTVLGFKYRVSAGEDYALTINKKEYYCIEDLFSDSNSVERTVIDMLYTDDSELLVWLYLQSFIDDTLSINNCTTDIFLILMDLFSPYSSGIKSRCVRDFAKDLCSVVSSPKNFKKLEIYTSAGLPLDLIVDKSGNHVLHKAVRLASPEMVENIINNGIRPDISASISTEDGNVLKNMTPLHTAADWGRIDNVTVLLSKGASVNVQNSLGMTPLHRAVIYGYSDENLSGNPEIIRLLCKNGADVGLVVKDGDFKGLNPLTIASLLSTKEVVELLVNLGASVTTPVKLGFNPLLYSFYNSAGERNEIVKFLIQNGALINEPTTDGEYPLEILYSSKEIPAPEEIAQILIDSGADPNINIDESTKLLHSFVRNGDIKNVKILLSSKKLDVNIADQDGWTALHFAIRYGNSNEALSGNPELVSLLVSNKANVNQANIAKWTPLHMAARYGSIEIINQLLNTTAANDLSSRIQNGMTPLMLSLYREDKDRNEVVQLLAKDLPSADLQEKDGWTALHCIIRDPQIKAKKELFSTILSVGVNTEITDNDGMAPVHYLAKEGRSDLLSVLLPKVKNVNITSPNNGWTALHYALRYGNEEGEATGCIKSVKQLIKFGANPSLCNKEGWSGYSTAIYYCPVDFIKELLKSKYKPDDRKVVIDSCKQALSPMELALFNTRGSSLQIIQELLSSKVAVPKTFYNLAISQNRYDVAKIVKSGAMFNIASYIKWFLFFIFNSLVTINLLSYMTIFTAGVSSLGFISKIDTRVLSLLSFAIAEIFFFTLLLLWKLTLKDLKNLFKFQHIKRKILFFFAAPPVFFILSAFANSFFSSTNKLFSNNNIFLLPFNIFNEVAGITLDIFKSTEISLIATSSLYCLIIIIGFIIKIKIHNDLSIMKIFRR